MPIVRRYGAELIPRLAEAAGSAEAELAGRQLDRQIVRDVRDRQMEQDRLRFQRQLEEAKLAAQRRRRGSVSRAGRRGTTRDLSEQVREALERQRERQSRTPFEEASPYSDRATAREAVVRSGDVEHRLERVDGEERVVRSGPGGESVVEDAAVSQRRAPANMQRKQAFLNAINVRQMLRPEQAQALEQMAADDDVSLQDIRLIANEAMQMAPKEQGDGGGMSAQQRQMQFWSMRDRAEELRTRIRDLGFEPEGAPVQFTPETQSTKQGKQAFELYTQLQKLREQMQKVSTNQNQIRQNQQQRREQLGGAAAPDTDDLRSKSTSELLQELAGGQ